MPLKHPSLEQCELAFSRMQQHIHLRHWQQLDHAAEQVSQAMQHLRLTLQASHTISQQSLIQLSMLQRRTSRMLHNAMLSNRHDMLEVQQGLRALQRSKTSLESTTN